MIEDLTGNWTVKQAGTTDVVGEDQAAGEWLPAEVPVRVTVKTATDLDAEQVHRRLRIGSVAEAR